MKATSSLRRKAFAPSSLFHKMMRVVIPGWGNSSERESAAKCLPFPVRRQGFMLEALEPRLLLSADISYLDPANNADIAVTDLTLKAENFGGLMKIRSGRFRVGLGILDGFRASRSSKRRMRMNSKRKVAFAIGLLFSHLSWGAPPLDLSPYAELGESVDLVQAGTSNDARIEQTGAPHLFAASQAGDSNQLISSQQGQGHTLQVWQSDSANILEVSQSAQANSAVVYQVGMQNSISLLQSGMYGTARLEQVGVGNRIDASQYGYGQSLVIGQYGDYGYVQVSQDY